MGFWRPPRFPLRLILTGHPDEPAWTIHDPGDGLLDALLTGSWTSIVPGLLDEESLLDVGRRWADPSDPVQTAVLCRFAGEVTCVLTGQQWHVVTQLLLAVEEDRLGFEAWCAAHGMDSCAAPPYRLLGAAYAWLSAPLDQASAMADPADLAKARRKLTDEIHRRADVPALYPAEPPEPDDDEDNPTFEAEPDRETDSSGRRWSREEEAASFENTMSMFSRFQ